MRRPVWLLVLALALVLSALSGIGVADEGGGGNNLAVPVIFAEGYGLSGFAVDADDYTTTGFPGLGKCEGVEAWGGTDGAPYDIAYDATGSEPATYQLMIDGEPYLDPLKGTGTAAPGDYFLQPYTLDGDSFGMTTCFEADWVDGSEIDMVEINALDVGDSLVRVLRKETPNPIRVEFSPYQETETAGVFQDATELDGYAMTQLWPPSFSDGKPPSVGSGERQEVWATSAASASGPVPATVASVYSHNARLTIDRLSWTALPDSFADGNLEGYPTGVIPDTFEDGYAEWVAGVEYDGTVGGHEGESGFSSEVNQGGRALFGFNWGLGTGVETGWYRITLSIDAEVGGIASNATITGLNETDLMADESSGGSDTGMKGFFPPRLVEDADGNYVMIDVYISPLSDTGKGRIGGKVFHGADNLEGVTVTAYDVMGSPAAIATSAADGSFEMTVIPGTYRVGFVDPDGKYRGEFYNDKAGMSDADPVIVASGGSAYVAADLAEVEDPIDKGHFVDVSKTNTFYYDIEWMWASGITKGCNPPDNDHFCPADHVTRAQLASFVVRALGLTEGANVDRFVDDDGSTHEADINRLAAAGITMGCNPPDNDRFCPDDRVTRAQIASFFARAFELTAGADVDRFVDDDGSTHEADINRLAAAGITMGCNPPDNDRFCPDEWVPREQIAAFFHRAME